MATISSSLKYPPGLGQPFDPSLPNLKEPRRAQGETGRKLYDLVAKIVVRWSEQPPQGLLFPLEESETTAKQRPVNQIAIELLRSWREGDEQEQRETWEYLKQALNENRLSDRQRLK